MSWTDWGKLALGGAALYNSYSQGKAANKAANTSNDIAQQQMASTEQDREYYKSIYGDLEKNLSDYYTTLTPSKAEQLGLSRYDGQFKQAQDNYSKSMAQRGISGSGIDAEGRMAMDMQSAKDRTNIVQQADAQTRSEQLGFLGVGLGQGNIATQNAANAAANAQNSYNSTSSMYGKQASNSGAAFADLFKSDAHLLDNTLGKVFQ